ncbi:MAG: VCBS repeat-containing protein, partial [Planctomycetes bacterium]|nr:VCBS repeat-containing protein [Planctomycetota bacterium]
TGDIDGDGASELLATAPNQNGAPGRALLFSGRTGTLLRSFATALSNSGFGSDATGIDDCDGDGVRDVVVGANVRGMLFFYSGATGALIRTVQGTQSGFGNALCSAGDVNRDGRGDVAAFGNFVVEIISGANGALLGAFPNSGADSSSVALRVLPDLDSDGHAEILLTSGGRIVKVLDPFPAPTTRVVPEPSGSSTGLGAEGVGFADLDGDGIVELLLADGNVVVQGQRGGIFVISPRNGALLDTIHEPRGGRNLFVASLAGIGDLDADGREDVLMQRGDGTTTGLELLSGRTRTIRSYWTPTAQFSSFGPRSTGLANLGDVDGNGFGDLAIGNPYGFGSSDGQCAVLDARFLASFTSLGTGCGEGPFLPQLGVSRPVLGSTAQVVVRDAPLNAPGLLVLSAAPRNATNLGAQGCDVAFDLSAWAQFANLAGASSYSLPLPIPMVPQFAGLDIALQAFFIPTGGPLGFDLSNGVWARVGY